MVALPWLDDRPRPLTGLDRQVVGLAVAANATLAVVLVYLQVVVGIHTRELVQEPSHLAGLPAWAGAYSYLSVLVLTTGAAVALFSAALLGPDAHGRALRPALLAGGGYFAFAAVDDLFLLHDNGFFVGLPEVAALGVHVLGLGLVLLALAGAWRRTPWPILALALGLLAASTALDVVQHAFPGQGLGEEVVETTGMTLLVAYVVLAAARALGPRVRRT